MTHCVPFCAHEARRTTYDRGEARTRDLRIKREAAGEDATARGGAPRGTEGPETAPLRTMRPAPVCQTVATVALPRSAALHLSTRALVAFVLAAFFARAGMKRLGRNGSGRGAS